MAASEALGGGTKMMDDEHIHLCEIRKDLVGSFEVPVPRYRLLIGRGQKVRLRWNLWVGRGESVRAWGDKDGYLHRKDGPALERDNGIKEWYNHGWRTRAHAVNQAQGTV